ncbi:hypothetical protein TVAG_119010 [Trichomonas vaginalis G3]|uniref:Alpha-1,2-Mannosidase n=1 Tax=Trichomonas vaginalis (strain ATCC PRA-98 / G3) TaxID=412133 RepID=A2D748_TRIV3|nr:mannosyl-oligosaccharide 1,2-alpha-mannosidase protein [Trichomonas vaginalis G3]EAY23565.1 hypothetical protein TVAG_119010 [Trichomonas vaginalis G3]KAI5490063.1 mannosyl-oligosaccharide 1,2-alpha-mannosidase protein [Trichomonas vaginalis G3]|eukprot:XP_001276813.1 hypothetical protein [Trichomonas vaginalis G3]
MRFKRSLIIFVLAAELSVMLLSSIFIFRKMPNTEFIKEYGLINESRFNTPFKIPNNEINNYAREKIKVAFDEYWSHCRYSDYYKPFSGTCSNSSGLSLSLFGFLDALYLANLTYEYNLASNFVLNKVRPSQSDFISTYELGTTVIGSLLGIYGISGEDLFLQKAIEFADLLLTSFTGPIPHPFVDGIKRKPIGFGFTEGTFLGESSGFLLEFAVLAMLTKYERYEKPIYNFIQCVTNYSKNISYGIWSTEECKPLIRSNQYTQLTASFYINFLKISGFFKPNITQKIIDQLYDTLNDIQFGARGNEDNKFVYYSESLCEILGLKIENFDVKRLFAMERMCSHMREQSLPASFMGKEAVFNFDSTMIAEDFNRSISLEQVKKLECGNVICSSSSISNRYLDDLMPSKGISKWLKFLLLRNVTDSGYSFVMNDAGFLLPVTHEYLFNL